MTFSLVPVLYFLLLKSTTVSKLYFYSQCSLTGVIDWIVEILCSGGNAAQFKTEFAASLLIIVINWVTADVIVV